MNRQTLNNLDDQKNAILLQGVFAAEFFEELQKKNPTTIFVMEGRPTLEAAKNTSAHLLKRKITPTLISDNMAGFLFFKGLVKEVWIAYQLKDKDGALCDIGALILGVLAKKHQVPVYLFPAGRKTKFLGPEKSLLEFQNKRVAAKGIKAYVPLVEWLPTKYITKIASND